jgi:hypothetical protein
MKLALDPPLDLTSLRRAGHFPAILHPLYCGHRDDGFPPAVLRQKDVVAGLHVYDPDARVMGCAQVDDLRFDLRAEPELVPATLCS